MKKLFGFNVKIIADPILKPPLFGLMKSLNNYYNFKLKNIDVPVLFGSGNVTELIDADSNGINSLLASIGIELSISLIFTTESSNKTEGCIKELKDSINMVYLAFNTYSLPKNIGINCLILKEKNILTTITTDDITYLLSNIKNELIIINKKNTFNNIQNIEDFFLIHVILLKYEHLLLFKKKILLFSKLKTLNTLLNKRVIIVIFNKKMIIGKNGKEIMDYIIDCSFTNDCNHISYLSSELTKADFCLKFNRNYIQEM